MNCSHQKVRWQSEDEEEEECWLADARRRYRWRQVGKWGIRLVILALLLFLAYNNGKAMAESTTTTVIKPDSWVFVTLNSTTDTGEAEIMLIEFAADGQGAIMSQFDQNRILLIANPDDDVEFPPFHHYYLCDERKRVVFEDLMDDIDNNRLGVWNKVKSYAKEAGSYLWDASQNLSDWLDQKYTDWGVYNWIEEKGWGDKIRNFFGTDD